MYCETITNSISATAISWMAEICTFVTSLHLKIISSTVTNQRLRDDNYPRFPLDRSTFIIIQCEVFYIILIRRAPANFVTQ